MHRSSVRFRLFAQPPIFAQANIMRLEIGPEMRSHSQGEILRAADRHRGEDKGDFARATAGAWLHRLARYWAKRSPEAEGGTAPSLR